MKKLYLNHKQVEQLTHSIIRHITGDNWRPDYIVGLTRGGLLPATLISQYLDTTMYSLDVSLRDANSSPTSNAWMSEDAHDGKNILIVDDINDSGATLNWIVNDWKASCLPDSEAWGDVFGGNVRVATLVNNVTSKFTDIAYSGMEINKTKKDVWVVFPWEEWWTNKPE